jgi:DNA-binding transcriptional LysR family regulator
MELRHLRYFVTVGEEQHYRRAARRLRVAQPALSRQIQDLEEELGFKLFERLPRGVKLNAAGKLFLEDARRVLQELSEAAVRAGRVASGRSGTLRVGFTENASWRGVVPDSFRRYREKQPDARQTLRKIPFSPSTAGSQTADFSQSRPQRTYHSGVAPRIQQESA